MLAAGAERRAVEVDDLPRLRGGGEVALEPGDLLRAPRRVLERQLRVERDEMGGAVIEAVETLGVVRVGGGGAVPGQHEHVEIWPAVGVGRSAVMVAERREHRPRREPGRIHREEPRVQRLVSAAAEAVRTSIRDVAAVQREVELVRRDEAGELLLGGRAHAAVAEGDETHDAGAAGRRGRHPIAAAQRVHAVHEAVAGDNPVSRASCW